MTHKKTVLESSLDVFRAHSMTTVFGNPWSNELPFLAGLNDDFDFVLGLHEQVQALGVICAQGRRLPGEMLSLIDRMETAGDARDWFTVSFLDRRFHRAIVAEADNTPARTL